MIMMLIKEGTRIKSLKNLRWVHKGEACRADIGTPGVVIQDSANCQVIVKFDASTAKGNVLLDVADVDVIL